MDTGITRLPVSLANKGMGINFSYPPGMEMIKINGNGMGNGIPAPSLPVDIPRIHVQVNQTAF